MPDWDNSVRRRTYLAGSVAAVSLGVAGCLGNDQQGETLDMPETTATTGNETSGTTGAGTAETTGTADAGADGTLPTPIQGDPNADVTVVVFEDYACPHCRDYALNVAPEIISQYAEPGEIRYEFYDFPIPVDEQVSWEAACAARAVQAAAGDDAFFDYVTALFESQSSLGPDTYEQLATDAGLDGAAIRQAAVERAYESTVRADRELGQQAGVQGTPTVAVDRQVVRPTVDDISAAIDSA